MTDSDREIIDLTNLSQESKDCEDGEPIYIFTPSPEPPRIQSTLQIVVVTRAAGAGVRLYIIPNKVAIAMSYGGRGIARRCFYRVKNMCIVRQTKTR